MLLSQTSPEQMAQLTDAQKKTIIYPAVRDDGLSYDAALVLGGQLCEERAAAAAQLYHAGRVSRFIPTGGVEWDRGGEKISEALYLARLLRGHGIPEEAIFVENEARTTVENMIYGTLQIQRKLRIKNVHSVCVVTSDWHLKRSVGLAQLLLPRTVTVSGYAPEGTDPAWLDYYIKYELPLLKRYVDDGLIPDIEY